MLGFGRRCSVPKIFAPQPAQTRLAITSLIRTSAANILGTEHLRPKPSTDWDSAAQTAYDRSSKYKFLEKNFFRRPSVGQRPNPTLHNPKVLFTSYVWVGKDYQYVKFPRAVLRFARVAAHSVVQGEVWGRFLVRNLG